MALTSAQPGHFPYRASHFILSVLEVSAGALDVQSGRASSVGASSVTRPFAIFTPDRDCGLVCRSRNISYVEVQPTSRSKCVTVLMSSSSGRCQRRSQKLCAEE